MINHLRFWVKLRSTFNLHFASMEIYTRNLTLQLSVMDYSLVWNIPKKHSSFLSLELSGRTSDDEEY